MWKTSCWCDWLQDGGRGEQWDDDKPPCQAGILTAPNSTTNWNHLKIWTSFHTYRWTLSVSVCVPMNVLAYGEHPPVQFLRIHSPFWRQGLSLSWRSPSGLDWLASDSPGTACLCLFITGTCTTVLTLPTWITVSLVLIIFFFFVLLCMQDVCEFRHTGRGP